APSPSPPRGRRSGRSRRWETGCRRDGAARAAVGTSHSPFDAAIYRERARTTHDKGRKAGEVQEITFVAYRPELSASGRHGDELDRAETVGQMHVDDGHEQKRSHG